MLHTILEQKHFHRKHAPALERANHIPRHLACLLARRSVHLARRQKHLGADAVLVHRLNRRVRVHISQLPVVVFGPHHHDRQLLAERLKLFRIQRQLAHRPNRLVKVLRAAHLKVAPSIIRPLARLEHVREPVLVARGLQRRRRQRLALNRPLRRHGDARAVEVLLLQELVLDQPNRLPRRVHGDLLQRLALADGHALGGNLLEHVGVDVLNLHRQHVDARGELADLGGVVEGAGDVLGVVANLLGGRARGVEDGELDVERRGGFLQHAAELPAA